MKTGKSYISEAAGRGILNREKPNWSHYFAGTNRSNHSHYYWFEQSEYCSYSNKKKTKHTVKYGPHRISEKAKWKMEIFALLLSARFSENSRESINCSPIFTNSRSNYKIQYFFSEKNECMLTGWWIPWIS